MRTLALMVLLAACDQGAKAAPPPAQAANQVQAAAPLLITSPSTYEPFAVTSDADFVAKANVILDQLFGVFSQGGRDCTVVAHGLRTMLAENRTKLDVLTQYGEQHKSAQHALEQAVQEPMKKMIPALTNTMTACSNDKDLLAALQELSAVKNLQRPR